MRSRSRRIAGTIFSNRRTSIATAALTGASTVRREPIHPCSGPVRIAGGSRPEPHWPWERDWLPHVWEGEEDREMATQHAPEAHPHSTMKIGDHPVHPMLIP